MKTMRLKHCAFRAVLGSSLLLQPSKTTAHAVVFDVNVQSPQFILYTDPYNGNEIHLGGFSGLFPVPGKPDSFYVITDRGSTTHITFANGKTYDNDFNVAELASLPANPNPNGPFLQLELLGANYPKASCCQCRDQPAANRLGGEFHDCVRHPSDAVVFQLALSDRFS
jgi:hypothetical protein